MADSLTSDRAIAVVTGTTSGILASVPGLPSRCSHPRTIGAGGIWVSGLDGFQHRSRAPEAFG